MQDWKIWIVIVVLGAVNLAVHPIIFRVDMTEEHRYSLSEPTKKMLQELEEPLEVVVLLDGPMNSSFLRLKTAAVQLLEELRVYGAVQDEQPVETDYQGLTPTIIHERAKDGQTVQTKLFPYALLRYKEHEAVVPLLVNDHGRSGEENINRSIELMEFRFAEAINALKRKEPVRVAFLEGHGELPEENVLDIEQQLSLYFRVDRGTLTGSDTQLDDYKVVIVADPQTPFSESDKYLLDQYVMRGGRVLWLLNGVRFSGDYLSKQGMTPVVPLDLGLQDLLFRYGVRVEPALVQDLQCLPIPVDVSEDPASPNFQPLPWTYAPLLLTSERSPITAQLGQVSATFCSPVSMVGGDDDLLKRVLLASSNHSAVTATPAKVDLGDLNPDVARFAYEFVPVGVLTEGRFPSLYAHQMVPKGVEVTREKRTESAYTRQIVVGSGSVIRNELQQGKPLPCGYDRYTQMQFANRDFIISCVLYLTDDANLIPLRQKDVKLRLLNDQTARENRMLIQIMTTLLPLLLLALVAAIYIPTRKHKYSHTK